MTQHQVILIFKALREGVEMSFHVLAPTVSFHMYQPQKPFLVVLQDPVATISIPSPSMCEPFL